MTERWTFEGVVYEWMEDNGYCCLIDRIIGDVCVCYVCPRKGMCRHWGDGGWSILDPRIPALEAENARLRKALEEVSKAEQATAYDDTQIGESPLCCLMAIESALRHSGRIARAALEKEATK